MIYTASQLFTLLKNEQDIMSYQGSIHFELMDINIRIKSKDSVGNLLQEWLKAWMKKNTIDFIESVNTQTFPDFLLNVDDHTQGLLEIKSFDYKRGPGFDLANFDSYCKSLTNRAYRLDSDYLIFGYLMDESGRIKIKDIWLKKIWELACPSGTYPIKVQEKRNVIYNIRPSVWYSKRSKYKPFESKEEFLRALNNTRYQYHQTRPVNSHWLDQVLKNYKSYTGISLEVDKR